jgi:hypothetical protein
MTAFSEKKVLDVLSQYASEPFSPAALSYGLSLGFVTNIPEIGQVSFLAKRLIKQRLCQMQMN